MGSYQHQTAESGSTGSWIDLGIVAVTCRNAKNISPPLNRPSLYLISHQSPHVYQETTTKFLIVRVKQVRISIDAIGSIKFRCQRNERITPLVSSNASGIVCCEIQNIAYMRKYISLEVPAQGSKRLRIGFSITFASCYDRLFV